MGFHAPVLLNYSHKKEWLGEDGGFNYRNVIEMSVEYLVARNKAIPRKQLRDLIGTYQFVEYASLDYSRAVADKNPEGSKWRVKSVEFPTSEEANEALIYRGKYIISYERLEDGDFSYFLDKNHNADLKDALTDAVAMNGGDDIKYLEDISDSFSFDRNEEGIYEYKHNLEIKFGPHDLNAGSSGPIIDYAKAVAEIILDNNVGNTFNGFLDSLFAGPQGWTAATTKKYFTETYDLVNGTCVFSKSFSTNQNANASDYQYKVTHTMKRDEKGLIEIQENGQVKGIKDGDLYNRAVQGVNDLIEGKNGMLSAHTRCNTVFNNYINKIDTSTHESLKHTPLNISKDFIEGSAIATYNISFSNNINNELGRLTERVMTLDKDESGHISIKENGTAMLMSKTKQSNFGDSTSYLNSTAAGTLVLGMADHLNRARHVLGGYYDRENLGIINWDTPFAPWGLHLVKLNDVSFQNVGKQVSWNIEYSTNPTFAILTNGTEDFTNYEVSVNDTLPIPMHSTYPILGWKELIHDADQTGLGKRSVTVKAKRKRSLDESLASGPRHDPSGNVKAKNILLDPIWPTDIINVMMEMAKHESWKLPTQVAQNYAIHIGTHFLTSASSSFDSQGNLSVTCEVSYIATRRARADGVTTDYTER